MSSLTRYVLAARASVSYRRRETQSRRGRTSQSGHARRGAAVEQSNPLSPFRLGPNGRRGNSSALSVIVIGIDIGDGLFWILLGRQLTLFTNACFAPPPHLDRYPSWSFSRFFERGGGGKGPQH